MNNSKTGSECQTVDVYFDVYVIWCRITDMHYIGVTGQKVATRIRQHKRGKQFVDKEIQRLGWEGNFDWWSVERNVPSDIITEREQYWIDFFHAVHPYGYNKTIGGIKHFKHSEETIERMRQAQLGRHHTEDTLAKMRNKRFSDETRAKISSSQRGKPMTEKAKAILREKALERDISGKNNPFFGKHHTEEAKEKNRQAHLGRTPWIDKLPTAKAGGLCYLQPMLLMKAKSDLVSSKGRCPNPGLYCKICYGSRRLLPLLNFFANFTKQFYYLQVTFAPYIPIAKARGSYGADDKGIPHSDETKAKMRAKALARAAAKRAAKAVAEENLAAANSTLTSLSTLNDAVILQ